jgi:hypothetical protein
MEIDFLSLERKNIIGSDAMKIRVQSILISIYGNLQKILTFLLLRLLLLLTASANYMIAATVIYSNLFLYGADGLNQITKLLQGCFSKRTRLAENPSHFP